MSGAAAPAQTGSSTRELAKLKAAYVLNFARYTQWPAEAFTDRDTPVVVGVLGDESFAAYLEALVAKEAVNGRPIVVRRLVVPSLDRREDEGRRSALAGELRQLHVIFIGSAAQSAVPWILDRVVGEDVLTVSDTDAFADRGGMLGLVVRNRRLAFDANVAQIERSPLVVSSQVLRLARIVEGRSS